MEMGGRSLGNYAFVFGQNEGIVIPKIPKSKKTYGDPRTANQKDRKIKKDLPGSLEPYFLTKVIRNFPLRKTRKSTKIN